MANKADLVAKVQEVLGGTRADADRAVESVIEFILYTLWDLGLKVGHSSRTVDDVTPGTSVFAGHGAFVVLTPRFFAAGGSCDYPFTLFGEELWLARECSRLGLEVRYVPSAVVRHTEPITGGPAMIMLRDTAKPMAADDPLFESMDHARVLGDKDLALALELGAGLGVDLPMATLAKQRLGAALGVRA
jgi:hypothetical protein